jgi:hypothetical protein
VEGVAQVDEAAHLARAVGRHGAGVEARVVRPHAHRLTVQPGQARDLRATVAPTHLEEGVAVEDVTEQTPHVVHASPLAGHDPEKRLLAAQGVVAARAPRCRLPDVGRQVGEEAADLVHGLRLVLHHVVHDSAALVHPRTAELFLGLRFGERTLDDGWSGDEHLGGVTRHQCEVRGHQPRGGQAGHGAHGGGGDRQRRHGPRHGAEAVGREHGVAPSRARALPGCTGHAAAPALEEAHEGHAIAARQRLGVDALAQPRR